MTAPWETPPRLVRLWREFVQWWQQKMCPTEFLCDNCRYDHPSACHLPQRPNAIKCRDYRPRA